MGDRQRGIPVTFEQIQASLDRINDRLPVDIRRKPVYPWEEIERIYNGRWVGLYQRTFAPGRPIDSARVLADAATPEVLERKVEDLKRQYGLGHIHQEFMGDPERIGPDNEVIILATALKAF